jgi:acyl-[acyl-carrier-protein]-phospholipid O-acyltransferase/long-chain-fatty-acid--[acyl-carrier-protein] ligase
MAADSKAWQVRQKVAELSSDYFKDLKEGRLSLAEHFIKTARKNWKKPCISDSSGANQTYRKVLLTSLALARHFKDRMKRQQRIAILLPHSVEAVYANIAVTMMGASAVNLDLAQSEREIESHINKCGIKTIITTKNCFDKTGLKSSSATLLFLDDFIMQTEGMSNPLLYLKARLAPSSILAGRNKGDNEATVIFSHQSDSEPEAVSLSHRNIYCNIEATRQVLRFVDSDKINAVYPFSNPMGFTYSLWLPIISGIPVCFTDSSLSQAESSGLPRAKSGFGQAQFSGFLSLNVPDVESGGVFQIGTKPQTLGHPIPGVAVRIIDIETQQPLPPGQKGILLVKGPIVFAGYLDNQRTSQISNDGWFNTGKIASLDEDGFLTI